MGNPELHQPGFHGMREGFCFHCSFNLRAIPTAIANEAGWYPKLAGWFMENPIKMDDDWGYPSQVHNHFYFFGGFR